MECVTAKSDYSLFVLSCHWKIVIMGRVFSTQIPYNSNNTLSTGMGNFSENSWDKGNDP